MASVLEVPHSVLRGCLGSVHIELSETGAAVYIRSSPSEASGLARHMKAEVKLPSWETPPIVAVALLVRLGGRPDLTYLSWINAGNPRGIRTLQQFSRTAHIPVHVVTDRIERSLRATNLLRVKAGRLVDALAPRIHAWSHAVFDETTRRLDQLYPTPARLWGECLRADRVGAGGGICGSLAT